ncbi:aquaporin-like protein [Lipomyces oligophaga]|uniref:aquaporin-like protein n=1 Tax=Lipomyces oligophaga TaxID=45792 RepID=UPI0034CEF643
MAEPSSAQDVEKNHDNPSSSRLGAPPTLTSGSHVYHTSTEPFTGRIGGNQAFIVDRDNSCNASILQRAPDAAPGMTLAEQFDLRPFQSVDLWKAAAIEGMGSFMYIYITIWIGMSPDTIPLAPNGQFGNFNNAAFIGPVVGGFSNFVLLALFTFVFGPVSGAHLNPTITIATFCARLCSFPRMVLYVALQTTGGALAGLMARASYGSREFKVGGCWLYTDVVPVADAFAVEFMTSTLLLFFAFGVGLDPRQRQLIGPSLAPFLVGMALGICSFGTAFTRYGYGGASLNPARCFGAFVGSRFPGWHWIHWAADIVACVVHGCFYLSVPPWQKQV